MSFDKVLVPIDFSEDSIDALETALLHFKGAKMYLLTVIEEAKEDALTPDVAAQFRTEAQDAAYERLRYLIAKHPAQASKMEPLIACGKPVGTILETASNCHVDLIVMSSHGKNSIAKTLFGHTTYHVSRKAQCSVWVIKGQTALSKSERVA